jgi:hypothetical protein
VSRLLDGLVKLPANRIVANNNDAGVLTDAEIHAWIDAGELATV